MIAVGVLRRRVVETEMRLPPIPLFVTGKNLSSYLLLYE